MPKKILFFCGASYVFGKEIVTLNLLKELKKNGVIVHCIVSGWNNGDFIQRLSKAGISFNEVKLGFFYLRKPLWTLDSIVHYPAALSKIRKILHEFKPDILYFYSERTMVSVYPLISRRKVILHIHEPIANSKLNNFIIRKFSGNKITYVVCSNFILSKLSSLLNLQKEDVHVIYSAIEIKERVPALKNNGAVVHVGVVGQLRHHKGQDILLRALGKLKDYNFKCSVYGSGEETYEGELKALAKELGILERVCFKGFEKDIEQIYQDLDIVVVPSRFEEPFGLVAIEPAQWKIPVIVSNKGGLPEVVLDKTTGLVFESGNVDDLAEKILFLYKDEKLRNELGSNAIIRVKKLFSSKVMGDSFLKILK